MKIEYVFPGVSVVRLIKKSAVLPVTCWQSTSVRAPHDPSKTNTRLKQASGAMLATETFISASVATKEYHTPGLGILKSVHDVDVPDGSTWPLQVLPAVQEALTVNGVALAQVAFVVVH